MYIRFVIHALDPDSGRRQGLFQALGELASAGKLAVHEQAVYEATRSWFAQHLAAPDALSRSRKSGAHNVALSWFKPSATEHIARMRAFAAILENHDVAVDIVKHDRLGYIVYEDDHQIAAVPYQDTRT